MGGLGGQGPPGLGTQACSPRQGWAPLLPHSPLLLSPSPRNGRFLAQSPARPAWQGEQQQGQAGPLCPGLPHHPRRPRSAIPQAAQGSPQPPSPAPGSCSPSPSCAHCGGGHSPSPSKLAHAPKGGFPSQPGKAQVGRGWGEGGRGLRGFQPGNKTERPNPASKFMVTCRGTGGPTGKLGTGPALRRPHFNLGPNLQAPES